MIIFVLSLSLFAKEGYSLKVKVDGLRNSKGVVQFALYNKDGSLPDEKFKKYFKKKVANIKDRYAEIVFKDLPKGVYAVNILHDENKNSKVDKGFILPVEGVGLSNFKSINIANKPNFKKASFFLDRDKETDVKVIYF
jgi:uncharacterized protein (DUF2141 family)